MLSRSQFLILAASGLGPLRMNISAALLYSPQVRKSGFTPIASNNPRTYGASALKPVIMIIVVGVTLIREAPAASASGPVSKFESTWA